MKQNKGFTLIEILAVIAIIAILATFAGVSVMNAINSSREELLQDQIKSVKDTAITYILNQSYSLRPCSTSFDETNPSTTEANCYRKITISNLINSGLFENRNDLCDPNGSVLVYRKNYGTYSELASYMTDDVCAYR